MIIILLLHLLIITIISNIVSYVSGCIQLGEEWRVYNIILLTKINHYLLLKKKKSREKVGVEGAARQFIHEIILKNSFVT